MEEFLAKLPEYVDTLSTVLSVIVIIATALVRIPGLNKHSKDVNKVVGYIQKVLSWLPTLGLNPSTKSLKDKADKG